MPATMRCAILLAAACANSAASAYTRTWPTARPARSRPPPGAAVAPPQGVAGFPAPRPRLVVGGVGCPGGGDVLEGRVDPRPRRLDPIAAREKRGVAAHRRGQQPPVS